MTLWFLCCVLLFIASRGYDWISHQGWFLTPELSLPWLVLGGLGLAIASNGLGTNLLRLSSSSLLHSRSAAPATPPRQNASVSPAQHSTSVRQTPDCTAMPVISRSEIVPPAPGSVSFEILPRSPQSQAEQS
ncbi:MAG: hypothetical protein ACFBSG_00250 [Leptolyngbyaceae cyanobacterium]